MKILWLINIMLPQVAESLNQKRTNTGGWLVTISKLLPQEADLVILYPDKEERKIEISGTVFYGIRTGDNENAVNMMEETMSHILADENPDIIHIWGTEHLHSYAMTMAAKSIGMIDRVVVSIQGLVSYYATHYMANLPYSVIKRPSFRDLIKNDSLEKQQKKMSRNGEYEKKVLKMTQNVIGRTSWDYNCTKLINPSVKYYFNNEILRNSFYQNEWNLDRCERYTIFISQAQYPIKGFHVVIEAVSKLVQKYPDVRVIVSGSNDPLSHGMRAKRYNKYLYKLAEKFSITDKILYVGNLTEEEMCKRYLKAHVFVCPSVIENSPNSVGEAMLLGMPVVASYVGGTSDLLSDKIDGFLYPFDEPYMLAGYVDSIFSDEKKAVELGKNARLHAQRTHDVSENYKTLVGIYRSIDSQCRQNSVKIRIR